MRRRVIKSIIKFNILFLFSCCNAVEMYTNNTRTVHLKNEIIKDICGKMDEICLSSYMHLCTVRMVKGKLQFKEFQNNCYLFLYNMCVYPGNEWAIKDVGSCKKQNLRRYADEVEKVTQPDENYTVVFELTTDASSDTVTEAMTDANTETGTDDRIEVAADETNTKTDANIEKTAEDNTEFTGDNAGSTTDTQITADGNTELTTDDNTELTDSESLKLALRTLPHTTYGVEQAPDGHNCPYHCPSVYSPVCVNVNRGEGKYYRLLFFVNHCEADRHYCLHWETEYQPPPNEEYEMVRAPSNAAWSYCAGNKYMNFATFAESASSMAHYGWLKGDQRASHIMEPYERAPGYG